MQWSNQHLPAWILGTWLSETAVQAASEKALGSLKGGASSSQITTLSNPPGLVKTGEQGRLPTFCDRKGETIQPEEVSTATILTQPGNKFHQSIVQRVADVERDTSVPSIARM